MLEANRIYRLIHEIASEGLRYSVGELAEIEDSSRNGSTAFRKALDRVHEWLRTAETAKANGDGQALQEAIVHLRIHLMGLASEVGYAVDALTLLIQRD